MRAIETKALIIDDDFEIYMEIKKVLQSDGVYMEFVPGYDVIEQINRPEVCLVIININRSSEECFKLIKKIRLARAIPILVLASKVAAKRIDVFHAGAHGYLEYPYTIEECAAYVKSLMDLYWRLRKDEKQRGALGLV